MAEVSFGMFKICKHRVLQLCSEKNKVEKQRRKNMNKIEISSLKSSTLLKVTGTYIVYLALE